MKVVEPIFGSLHVAGILLALASRPGWQEIS